LQQKQVDDLDAQYFLGNMYYKGLGSARNFPEAVRWFRKVSDQKYSQLHERWTARYTLGDMYYNGEGVPKDYGEALRWYSLAAEIDVLGTALAQVGDMYYKGQGTSEDHAEAVRWYMKAAAKDNEYAQLRLAMSYDAGDGVQKSDSQAANWYMKAADQGSESAMLNLGNMYSDGRGLPRDYSSAMEWYRKAADKGLGGAMVTFVCKRLKCLARCRAKAGRFRPQNTPGWFHPGQLWKWWCGRGDLNPHDLLGSADFHTTSAFAARQTASSWSGLSLHHSPREV
jgi:TPR repeat protein